MPRQVPLAVVGILLPFVAACCALDLRTRRIPNLLTLPALALGLLLAYCGWGSRGLLSSGLGAAVALVVLAGPFALGGIGGGDVKMMVAAGAFLGPRLVLYALSGGMLFGGIVMLVHLLRVQRVGETLRSMWGMVFAALATKSLAPLRRSGVSPQAISLPYSVPLGLGIVVAMAATRFTEALP